MHKKSENFNMFDVKIKFTWNVSLFKVEYYVNNLKDLFIFHSLFLSIQHAYS